MATESLRISTFRITSLVSLYHFSELYHLQNQSPAEISAVFFLMWCKQREFHEKTRVPWQRGTLKFQSSLNFTRVPWSYHFRSICGRLTWCRPTPLWSSRSWTRRLSLATRKHCHRSIHVLLLDGERKLKIDSKQILNCLLFNCHFRLYLNVNFMVLRNVDKYDYNTMA